MKGKKLTRKEYFERKKVKSLKKQETKKRKLIRKVKESL